MGLLNQQAVHQWCDSIFLSTLVVCSVALCPGAAMGQAAPAPLPPAYEGSAEFAFIGTTGNASAQTIGLGGELILRPVEWAVRNKAAYMRNKADGVLTAEAFQYLLRGERLLNPRTAVFGEDTYFQDRFAGIAHRNSIVGGIAYKLIDLASHSLAVDGGLGHLNEERLSGDDISSTTYLGFENTDTNTAIALVAKF